MRAVLRLALALALAAALTPALACVNDDVHLYEVRLHGSIAPVIDPAATGTVHLVLHHARAGAGETAHPLGPIDARTLDAPGDYDETFLVPTDDGEGLVVYAWLDVDGDGILCSAGGAIEPAGLTVVDGFPAHDLEVDVALEAACAGPEALYP